MSKRTIHGIDLTAPGGLEALFAYRRAQFGDAVMELGAGDGDGGATDGAGDADKGAADAGAADAKDKAADAKTDLWDDPAKAKAEIERLRAENGKDRTTAKTKAADDARNEITQTLGKALGLIKDGDDKPDPAKLAQQITETAATARQAQTELAVYKAANKQGADADALLDSRAFLAKIAELDPTKTADIEKAIKDAVTDNPKLKTVQAAGTSGANFTGGSGEGAKKPTTLAGAVANHYRT
jgi:hypothetical protein